MESKKCSNCSENRNCSDSFTSWLFFIIGIVATNAVRLVTPLIDVNPVYAKAAWYAGITGFFAFFVYKFRVSRARARVIESANLLERVSRKEQLRENDYATIGAILCSLSSKKEMINYFFIFGLSAVAIAVALYMDFLR